MRFLKNIVTGGLFIIIATCFFYACSSTSSPTESIPPTIQIDYPDSHGIIKNGDTLGFSGTISDNSKLHSMYLTVEGLQGQVYHSYNPTVDGLSTFHFNTTWLVYGIPYDTIGYLNVFVTDQSDNYAQKHWYMRLRL